MSDYQAAGIAVSHDLYVLRTVIIDLEVGFVRDAAERRFISGSKDEIADAIAGLTRLLEQIERADTSQTVRKEGVYGPMCRDPDLCRGKGYCPRDPTCAD